MQSYENEKDETARKHLALLKGLLAPETEVSSKTVWKIQDTGFAAFADLMLLYVSGEVVIQTRGDVTSAGILRDVHLGKSGFTGFSVDVVDWNWEMFEMKNDRWVLFEYKGRKRLTDHFVLPLRYHLVPEQMFKSLIARATKFE